MKLHFCVYVEQGKIMWYQRWWHVSRQEMSPHSLHRTAFVTAFTAPHRIYRTAPHRIHRIYRTAPHLSPHSPHRTAFVTAFTAFTAFTAPHLSPHSPHCICHRIHRIYRTATRDVTEFTAPHLSFVTAFTAPHHICHRVSTALHRICWEKYVCHRIHRTAPHSPHSSLVTGCHRIHRTAHLLRKVRMSSHSHRKKKKVLDFIPSQRISLWDFFHYMVPPIRTSVSVFRMKKLTILGEESLLYRL